MHSFLEKQPPSPFMVFKQELSGYSIIRKSDNEEIAPYILFNTSNWTFLLEELKQGTNKDYELKVKIKWFK